MIFAEWINELYNYMTSAEGRDIISNGWDSAFITEAIVKGKEGLEPLAPFFIIDPLLDNDDQISEEVQSNRDDVDFFITRAEDESESEDDDWIFEGEEVRNIFDLINDEQDE